MIFQVAWKTGWPLGYIYELTWKDFIDLINAVTQEEPPSPGARKVDMERAVSDLKKMDAEIMGLNRRNDRGDG